MRRRSNDCNERAVTTKTPAPSKRQLTDVSWRRFCKTLRRGPPVRDVIASCALELLDALLAALPLGELSQDGLAALRTIRQLLLLQDVDDL